MKGWIRKAVAQFVHATGRGSSFYRRFCRPTALEWGAYLSRWGNFHSVGSHFHANPGSKFLDPSLVRIGNSVGLADCTLIGHDGVVLLIEHRFGKHLDSVGYIDIKDNCFIGHGAIIMPRVTIGPESIAPPARLDQGRAARHGVWWQPGRIHLYHRRVDQTGRGTLRSLPVDRPGQAAQRRL